MILTWMDVIQTDITDQTGMLSTTPMSSTPLLNADGNAGSNERNDNSGNGTNTGIENQTDTLLSELPTVLRGSWKRDGGDGHGANTGTGNM